MTLDKGQISFLCCQNAVWRFGGFCHAIAPFGFAAKKGISRNWKTSFRCGGIWFSGGGNGGLLFLPCPVLPRFHALIFPAFLKVFGAVALLYAQW